MERDFVDKIWSQTKRKNDPYKDLLELRKKSYEEYKRESYIKLQNELEKIGAVDNIIKTKKVINLIDSFKQSSKSRSGRNLELFISKILTQYNISFYEQQHNGITGDFIFEVKGKMIILSIKNTLRERWKEFLADLNQKQSEVFILTLDDISPSLLEKLRKHKIRVINHDVSFKDFLLNIKMTETKVNLSLNFIDLFCGAGGMSVGFEKEDFVPLIGIDSNLKAIETYKINRSEDCKVLCDNIKNISANQIQELVENQNVHLIVGGPPCTSVSMAGKRDPNDIRNTLFMDFIRMVRYFKPQIVVMENVVGLLSAKDKEGKLIIDSIIAEYKEAGYRVKYKKMNAYDYGVPQKRKRIIFVCVRDDIEKEYFFPEGKAKKKNVGSVLEEKVDDKYYFSQKMVEGFRKRKEANRNNGKGYGYQILNPEEPSYTISARYYKDGAEAIVDDNGRWRKLTEREVARIQTFPEDYKFSGNSSDVYTQIGNAVPCLLAASIAKSIKDFLKGVKLEVKTEDYVDEVSYQLTYSDLLSYNKTELINFCKTHKIVGYSKYKKGELVEYIKEKLELD